VGRRPLDFGIAFASEVSYGAAASPIRESTALIVGSLTILLSQIISYAFEPNLMFDRTIMSFYRGRIQS
jgi:hypothetical protein